MQVVFLGGASGVGASCVALELGGKWIVVDAGVRVDKRGDPLPDLALLDGKAVQAIFVTHAHADHIGALPLVHQAFPTAPIFASRATSLLMEVMLADALKIMSRRAAAELETPLYPESLVAGMLNQVRPLPVGQRLSLPPLPDVTVETTRAGHVAGAISLGFSAPDGTVVISGDVSMTPQRTVLGAALPKMAHPDLLVLESTYGARLHPNRQAEEQRLAEGVAAGIARGGHVLVPCFALGRAQEILLILQSAQQKGDIPPFPIWVDGLGRRVCATYRLIPEALTPSLQRQIRKGFDPFAGQTVKMVQDERERERILAGPPACIVASSGMLTGGPSAWFALRLASRPEASIMITGYQDEESPGKRLLDLAEQKTGLLDLGGQQVQVACQVSKYSLSAHADGGELAALASALRPATVMLVHGDQEAREALQERLVGMEVALPSDGSGRVFETKRARPAEPPQAEEIVSLEALPEGIGGGAPLEPAQVERLWEVVMRTPALDTVTARQLALIWYGTANEETEQAVQIALSQAGAFFVPLASVPGAYQARERDIVKPARPVNAVTTLAGQIILVRDPLTGLQVARCIGVERAARVSVQWPEGQRARTHFPLLAVQEVVGPFSTPAELDWDEIARQLAELVKRSRQLRQRIALADLARQMEPERTYSLEEVCPLAGMNPEVLVERLAVALVLARHPRLFMQQAPVWERGKAARYSVNPSWREAASDPAEVERPDQTWILSIVERHLGTPPGLYRRSVDPLTGQVTLAFHFPDVARVKYAEAIAAAAAEAEVEITVAPQAHQGALVEAAQKLLPAGLALKKAPAIHLSQKEIHLRTIGQADDEALKEAQERFAAETGWKLVFERETQFVLTATSAPASRGRMEQNAAQALIRQTLGPESGLYKVGIEVSMGALVLRFHFPAVARVQYAEQIAALEQQTGWKIEIYSGTHQGALDVALRSLLPPEAQMRGAPSLHYDEQQVVANYEGTLDEAAIAKVQEAFLAKTGWKLLLKSKQQVGSPSS